MAKAILVIDMPESCDKCGMARLVNGNQVMRSIDRMVARSYSDATKGRPDRCPLVPMPEKKEKYLSINNEKGYCEGWNVCIDTIGGNESD